MCCRFGFEALQYWQQSSEPYNIYWLLQLAVSYVDLIGNLSLSQHISICHSKVWSWHQNVLHQAGLCNGLLIPGCLNLLPYHCWVFHTAKESWDTLLLATGVRVIAFQEIAGHSFCHHRESHLNWLMLQRSCSSETKYQAIKMYIPCRVCHSNLALRKILPCLQPASIQTILVVRYQTRRPVQARRGTCPGKPRRMIFSLLRSCTWSSVFPFFFSFSRLLANLKGSWKNVAPS